MSGFVEFIRTQGVVGFAVGFILGGAVSDLVKSAVNDIVNPMIGPVIGLAGDLKSATFAFGPMAIHWGNFVITAVNFVIIAAVVYFGVKFLRLDKLDKPKG